MFGKNGSVSAAVCPQCGASIKSGSTVCQYCGTRLQLGDAGGQTKFCKFCGGKIPMDAVVCTLCGRQVEELKQPPAQAPQIVINNASSSTVNAPLAANRSYVPAKKPLSKWTAFFLCLFLGVFGAHKFYEGKNGLGILYLFTGGLCGIGALIDLISLLFKPNEYYV